MRSIFQKIKTNLYDWFIASNRWLHLMLGWGIFIVLAFAIGLPQGMAICVASVILGSYVGTLLTMVAVEIKDKAKGGEFDFKDVNAGMFLSNVCLLFWIVSLFL